MTQDEEFKDSRKPKGKERLSLSNFIFLACAVLGLAIAVLVAVFTTVSIWPIVLISAGILLALAMVFTEITGTKWFHLATSVTLIAALIASGIYIATPRKSPGVQQPPALTTQTQMTPKLDFVLTSPATVPWCNYFNLTTTGTIPNGYKILVFDATTDVNYNVTGRYSYDAVAKPVPRVPDEWTAGPVYVSSQYVQNGHGQNIIKNGKPVSNAGYQVAIFALILPVSDMQLLDEVGSAAWNLAQLPSPLASATPLDVVRNGNVQPCRPPSS